MAMKEWLQWLPPPRSLLALLLAVAGFSGRLFASHFTHSPTLLVDACHSLCRLVGLVTTLIAYKYERADEGAGREGKLRNTFGWARIEVVGRLSVHVLFASFALALVVNALQLGVHSSHGQPPRYPKVIVGSAVIGLLLYIINYMLLAGRELSYSRRLSMTEGGGVVLKTGAGEPILTHAPTDIASSLFVIGAGLTLEWEPEAAKIADPALSAVAAIVLVIFNYPFLRSAGLVLLQTVPEGLGACELRAAALRLPGVLAIHELHVWQLHRDRVVATAHVAYASHKDYLKSSSLVCDLFKRHGIGLVTLQPEFNLASFAGTDEEKKASIEFANIACSRPCAKECTARRCCEPPRKPCITQA
ncbi:proton-coupled zinc antiporter SLC30A1 [Amyelois transitella]|uniref:proton-coupled zinc antiporter SLC30A1 n=1 Tax=Amyelois transitella TaxID=680683 RepID=UPI00067E0EEB|nr:proton-coupled zinc antiporter SLC30A1 [Amyelois transitella]XP_060800881.1 proton-coupled zinc antiporter SLC30A1 [Amyelois transitella]